MDLMDDFPRKNARLVHKAERVWSNRFAEVIRITLASRQDLGKGESKSRCFCRYILGCILLRHSTSNLPSSLSRKGTFYQMPGGFAYLDKSFFIKLYKLNSEVRLWKKEFQKSK